jgi:Zn-dependent protease with chaperone function
MRIAVPAVLILVLAFSLPPFAAAQAPAGASAGPAASSAPVPVPPPSEKALRYYRSGNVLWAVGELWGLLVPALLLFTGFSARMRDVARKVGRNGFFTVAVYSLLFVLVTFVLDLPLAWYAGFVREHAYGLSSQTAAKWWTDALKGLAIAGLFGALTLWFPYLLLRRSPSRWWLYTGLAAVPLLVVLLFVTPIWIEPLFNHFGPMKDKTLEGKILALAGRAGIEGGRVYEVDKSVDTNTVNAYVTGLGGTKRIVLWDTILARLDAPEVLFVMGHEMGHYVLGHTFQLIALGSALTLFGLWVIHLTAGGMIERFGDRFGFHELSDVASAPLLLLLFSLVAFALSPVVLAVGRHVEHEADRFGLEITRDNHDCATAFAKLQQQNLAVPRPGLLYKLWRSDHPPLGERIDFCNGYRPWETGQPLRYGGLIRTGKTP